MNKVVFINGNEIPTCMEILNDNKLYPFDLNSFIIFSRKTYSEENILLWIEIQNFKKNKIQDNNEKYIKLLNIYNIYIKDNSEMEVNLTNYESIKEKQYIKNIINNILIDIIDTNIFNSIEIEILSIINNNLYLRFINNIISKERVLLSKNEALWWKNKNINFSTFFRFPDPINEAESRLHNICLMILCIISIILDRILYFPYLYLFLIYGFFTRLLCGPKLDPQAFIVLFILRPIFSDKFNIIKTKFVPGPPKRFSQFIGLCLCTICIILRYIYLFTNYNNDIILYLEYSIWSIFLIVSFVAGVFNYCFGCQIFYFLIYFEIVPNEVLKRCQLKYYYDETNFNK
jgi:hypothetical protein